MTGASHSHTVASSSSPESGSSAQAGVVLDRCLVSLVVAALFLERFEKDWWESGRLVVPDVLFVLSICLLAARLAAVARRGSAIRRLVSKEVALIGFVTLLGLLSVAAFFLHDGTLEHGSQVAKTYAHVVFLMMGALLIGRTFSRGRLVEWALVTYFVLAVLISSVTIVQAIDQNLVSFGFADTLGLRARTNAEVFARPMATFSEPAYLGYATLVGAFIGVGLVARRHRIVAWVGVTLCIVAFLLAGSVGAIALAAVLLTFLAFRQMTSSGMTWRREALVPLVALILLVCSTLAVVAPVRETITGRVGSIVSGSDPSAQLRAQQNRGSIEIWKKAPVTGVGLGNTRFYLPEYIDVLYEPGIGAEFSAANAYLGLLGEVGPLGTAALGVLLLLLITRNHGVTGPAEPLTQLFMLMVFLQFFIIGTFVLPPFWFWAGLRIALQRRASAVPGLYPRFA